MRRIEWSRPIGSGSALVGITCLSCLLPRRRVRVRKKHLSLQEYILVVSFCSDPSKFSRAVVSDLRESEPNVVIILNIDLFDNSLICDHGGGTQ